MIVVTGHIVINPEHRETVEDAIRTLVAATRAEDGNEQYRYAWDIVAENQINIEERWADEAAMNEHMGTEHLATFMQTIGPCIGGEVSIVRYDVSGSQVIF